MLTVRVLDDPVTLRGISSDDDKLEFVFQRFVYGSEDVRLALTLGTQVDAFIVTNLRYRIRMNDQYE